MSTACHRVCRFCGSSYYKWKQKWHIGRWCEADKSEYSGTAMMTQTLHLDGKAYVVVEKAEYERLTTLAKAAELPLLPKPDAQGNFPAVEYGCASIARGIICDRGNAGWSQKELARRAGIRVKTLCRIETGGHLPSVATIEKIDKAFKSASSKTR